MVQVGILLYCSVLGPNRHGEASSGSENQSERKEEGEGNGRRGSGRGGRQWLLKVHEGSPRSSFQPFGGSKEAQPLLFWSPSFFGGGIYKVPDFTMDPEKIKIGLKRGQLLPFQPSWGQGGRSRPPRTSVAPWQPLLASLPTLFPSIPLSPPLSLFSSLRRGWTSEGLGSLFDLFSPSLPLLFSFLFFLSSLAYHFICQNLADWLLVRFGMP